MSILAEAGNVIAAIFTFDSYEMKSVFQGSGVWLVFGVLTLLGGLLVVGIYRLVPWIERNLERAIIVYTYLVIAYIIFSGVIQRFAMPTLVEMFPIIPASWAGQPSWSTTIPPLLFMVMAWFGASYNVKLRTHLAFSEFRTKMPRPMQFAVLTLDAILWLGLCIIVVTTTVQAAANSAANFQIVFGTDDIMQWWFLVTVPLAFVMMAGRVIENWLEDRRNYKSGALLIEQAVIGGDAI